jgi:hypothetical protein
VIGLLGSGIVFRVARKILDRRHVQIESLRPRKSWRGWDR